MAQIKKKRKPPVRPSQKLFDEIVEWVSEGKTLSSFCRQPNRPTFKAVYDWLDRYPEFELQFARARKLGFDMIAEDCFKIADEMPPIDDKGRTDAGFVSWQKNRVWTRTQLLAKWDRRRYGDGNDNQANDNQAQTIQKVQIEVIGKDDAN